MNYLQLLSLGKQSSENIFSKVYAKYSSRMSTNATSGEFFTYLQKKNLLIFFFKVFGVICFRTGLIIAKIW